MRLSLLRAALPSSYRDLPSIWTCSLAMGAHPDPAFARETLEYALAKAREQDLIYFFRGVAHNTKTRRELTTFFKDNYDTVRPIFCRRQA